MRMTPKLAEEIRTLFREGMSIKDISVRTGWSPATIRRSIGRTGKIPVKTSEEQKAEAKKLFNTGMSILEISRTMSIPAGTIGPYLPKAGNRQVIEMHRRAGHVLVEKDDIIFMHLQGMTNKEIAEKLGSSRTNVGNHLTKMGFKHHKKIKPDDAAEITRLSSTGLSQKEVAIRTGFTRSTINRFLNKED
jgi:DNA invertase Pin-like site-specific DNA recombinase